MENLKNKIIIDALNLDCNNKENALLKISQFLVDKQLNNSKPTKIKNSFLIREKQGTTNLGEGFAFPHILLDSIEKPTIVIARFKKEIKWSNDEDKNKSLPKVKFVVALALPKGAESTHLEIISKLGVSLLDKSFLKNIYSGSKSLAIESVKKALFGTKKSTASIKKNTVTKHKGHVSRVTKVVAISTCPTGIAHTHMAAEQLIRAAKKLNIDLKIEKQAAEGVINELTKEDIKSADYVLIAAGKQVDKSRFSGKLLLEVPISKAIKSPEKVLSDTLNVKNSYDPSHTQTNTSGVKKRHNNIIMNAIMNGLSYIIPIVIVSGLLMAITIGIGKAVYGPDFDGPTNPASQHSFLGVINFIAGQGFTIMIPVLAAFTAVAIGDKIAMAPAFILALACNVATQDNQNASHFFAPFFNFQTLTFANFTHQSPLGFFGAIAIGLLSGYGALLMKKIKFPNFIRPIVPIMIIPITLVIVIWFIVAFALYLPLYYLSVGLGNAVNFLSTHHLLAVAGLVLGAMIAFDMGGPLNKTAFLLSVQALTGSSPEGYLMGMSAAAIAVPPVGFALGYVINKYMFRRKESIANSELAKTAGILGFMGITEGAIPFVIKNPRYIIASVAGGMVGGAVAGAASVTDSAAHGGFIVYLLGAIGRQTHTGPVTDYVHGLFYIIAIFAGSLVTALLYVILYKEDSTSEQYASVLE